MTGIAPEAHATPDSGANVGVPHTTDAGTACLFFCHGARDPAWRVPFEAIVARFRHTSPAQPVALGFLELMQPDFDTVCAELVATGARHVHVVPLFLAPGSHTRRDLPALVEKARERYPRVRFSVAATLAEDPAVRQAILDSALQALREEQQSEPRDG